MVERRTCSFCGNEIEPGTGKIYAKIAYYFLNYTPVLFIVGLLLLKFLKVF